MADVDFLLTGAYADEITDATTDTNDVGSSMGSKTGVGDTINDMNYGNDSVRRDVTPIHRVIMYLNRLGLLNKEQLSILLGMYGAIIAITGTYLIYWAIKDFCNMLQQTQVAIAAGETAAHAVVQDWFGIGMAIGMSALAVASLSVGIVVGEYYSSQHQADYTTPQGQRQITRDVSHETWRTRTGG